MLPGILAGPALPTMLVENRRLIRVLLHCFLIPWGYALAFALRFDFVVPEAYQTAFWVTLPFLLVVRLGTFAMFGVYNGWWRHAGLYDLAELAKAITVGSALFVAVLFVTRQVSVLPRSVFLLEWGAAILTFGGFRFGVRWMREAAVASRKQGKRALIVGAGDTAASFLRELRTRPANGIRPVGLVDDDPLKAALKLHGVSVLGTTADLPRLLTKQGAELVIVAIPSATRQVMRKIAERCANLDVELKVVPGLSELLHGTERVGNLRTVAIEEVLGRSPVNLELNRVAEDVSGRIVMITGGAGSIGSELARQIAGFGPDRLILVDQAESPLYFVRLELARKHPELKLVPQIADVTDAARMGLLFDEHRPDYVFHAAAYKHVPLMEGNPSEAVRNNVFGTLTTAEIAVRYGVQKFVLISTDKAVRPSSIMGATKRVAERIVLGLPEMAGASTDFRVVRFGNVLGSDGSVVPLFRRQIMEGGPVTVTDAAVTRYFMTIPEAVQLVLQAASLPETNRKIAMLEMGRPVRILELAENLIRLSGFEPYSEMPIVFTGLRAGEKLHEELATGLDSMVPTSVEQIWTLAISESDGAQVRKRVQRLAQALAEADDERLILALCDMVPECVSPLRDHIPVDEGRAGASPLLAS